MGRVFREEFGGLREEFGAVRSEIHDMHDDVKSVDSGIKGMRDDVKAVHSEINGLHDDVRVSFDGMAKRYDAISLELVRTREELTRAVDTLVELVKKFVKGKVQQLSKRMVSSYIWWKMFFGLSCLWRL